MTVALRKNSKYILCVSTIPIAFFLEASQTFAIGSVKSREIIASVWLLFEKRNCCAALPPPRIQVEGLHADRLDEAI